METDEKTVLKVVWQHGSSEKVLAKVRDEEDGKTNYLMNEGLLSNRGLAHTVMNVIGKLYMAMADALDVSADLKEQRDAKASLSEGISAFEWLMKRTGASHAAQSDAWERKQSFGQILADKYRKKHGHKPYLSARPNSTGGGKCAVYDEESDCDILEAAYQTWVGRVKKK